MIKDKLICDFCLENHFMGVYATDHGPFSMAYCEECTKHPNIRCIFNALSKYGRFGEDAFNEYAEPIGVEPNVYYQGEYISLREFVKIFDINDLEKYVNIKDPLYKLIIDKFKNNI